MRVLPLLKGISTSFLNGFLGLTATVNGLIIFHSITLFLLSNHKARNLKQTKKECMLRETSLSNSNNKFLVCFILNINPETLPKKPTRKTGTSIFLFLNMIFILSHPERNFLLRLNLLNIRLFQIHKPLMQNFNISVTHKIVLSKSSTKGLRNMHKLMNYYLILFIL